MLQNATDTNALAACRVAVEADFDFASEEYRRFFKPGRATAFQAPHWMHLVHARLVAARGAHQHTITVRDDAGGLVAVIPLVRQRVQGVTMLQPADFGVCDYNAAVGDPAALSAIAADPRLCAELKRATAGAGLVLFRKVRADGFDVGALFGGMKASVGENAAYHCVIGEDFEAWRRQVLRKKFIKERGRLQRQAERDYGTYEHRRLGDAEAIREAFAFLKEARRGRYEENILEDKAVFDFYLEAALTGAATGEAVTYASYVAGEPVAVLFGLAGDGDFHAVLIGADTGRYERLSAGIQLLYRVIEMRHAEGHHVLDMCLGNPGYKDHFRPIETAMRNLSRARTPAGAAAGLVYHHAKPLKNMLKRLVPHAR